jgi:endogenous inhibitor of DNA gyrase (YacG/DUF329 family)
MFPHSLPPIGYFTHRYPCSYFLATHQVYRLVYNEVYPSCSHRCIDRVIRQWIHDSKNTENFLLFKHGLGDAKSEEDLQT